MSKTTTRTENKATNKDKARHEGNQTILKNGRPNSRIDIKKYKEMIENMRNNY